MNDNDPSVAAANRAKIRIKYSLVKGDLAIGEVSLKEAWLGNYFPAVEIHSVKGDAWQHRASLMGTVIST